jgi:hypothetical protein
MSRRGRPDYQGGGTIIRHGDPAWYSNTDKKKPKSDPPVVGESERAKRRRAEREQRELAKSVDALPSGMRSAYLIGTGPKPAQSVAVWADTDGKPVLRKAPYNRWRATQAPKGNPDGNDQQS